MLEDMRSQKRSIHDGEARRRRGRFHLQHKNRKKTNNICTIPDISSHPQQHTGSLWLLLKQFGYLVNVCLLHLSVAVAESLITKQCMRSDMCDQVYSDGVRCCAEDLCNGAKHTGAFVPLLVAPVAIITLMI